MRNGKRHDTTSELAETSACDIRKERNKILETYCCFSWKSCSIFVHFHVIPVKLERFPEGRRTIDNETITKRRKTWASFLRSQHAQHAANGVTSWEYQVLSRKNRAREHAKNTDTLIWYSTTVWSNIIQHCWKQHIGLSRLNTIYVGWRWIMSVACVYKPTL